MKYCTKCGKEMGDNERFCGFCGNDSSGVNYQGQYIGSQPSNYYPQNNYPPYTYPYNGNVNPNEVNGLWVIISFFVPLVGLIMAINDRDTRPKEATACGFAAAIGFVFGLIVWSALYASYM